MKDNRPINLDLTTLKYPLAAIVSILHRISGVFIFLGVALLLDLLDLSLQSEDGFADVVGLLDHVILKFFAWAVLAGLLFHLIAGLKHLLLDLGVGESINGALLGARLTLLLSAIAMIIAGVWIW